MKRLVSFGPAIFILGLYLFLSRKIFVKSVIRLLSRLPLFGRLADYDSRHNFNLAYNGTINSLLKFLFVTEIKLLKIIRYPFGISVAAKFVK